MLRKEYYDLRTIWILLKILLCIFYYGDCDLLWGLWDLYLHLYTREQRQIHKIILIHDCVTNPYGACDVFHTEKIVHVFIAGSDPQILRGGSDEMMLRMHSSAVFLAYLLECSMLRLEHSMYSFKLR